MIIKIFRISAASMSLMTKGAYLKLFLKICRENNSGSKGLSIGNCKTKNLTTFNGINWLKMGQIFIFFFLARIILQHVICNNLETEFRKI